MATSVIDTIVVRILSDITDYRRGMSNVRSIAAGVSRDISMLGARLAVAVSAPIALLGKKSVSEFATFEDSLVKAYALFEDINEQQKRVVRDSAVSMAQNSVNSAQDIAESYKVLAAAGYGVEQAHKSMAVFDKYAAAGVMELTYATNMLVKAQTSLGMASKDPDENLKGLLRTANALTKAGAISLADPEKIVRSINTKYGAALRQVGKTPEEGAAVLAAMAQRGTVAELAGEQGYIMLRDMQAAALDNVKAFELLGVAVYDADGKMRHTADILGDLEHLFIGITDKQKKAALAALGFTDRSVAATFMLIGASREIREFERSIKSAGNIINELAEKNMKSFLAQMTILGNRLQVVRIEIGEQLVPLITKLMKEIDYGVKVWQSWPPELRRTVVEFGALVAVGIPALVTLGFLGRGLRSVALVAVGAAAAYGLVTGELGSMVDGLLSYLGISDPVIQSLFNIGGAALGILILGKVTGLTSVAMTILGVVTSGVSIAFGVASAALAVFLKLLAFGPAGAFAAGYAFTMMAIMVAGAFESIDEAWGMVKGLLSEAANDVKMAFAGIKNAFMAGDLTLAAKVAGTLLQLEFSRIVDTLNDIWDDFVSDLPKRSATGIWKGLMAIRGLLPSGPAADHQKRMREEFNRQMGVPMPEDNARAIGEPSQRTKDLIDQLRMLNDQAAEAAKNSSLKGSSFVDRILGTGKDALGGTIRSAIEGITKNFESTLATNNPAIQVALQQKLNFLEEEKKKEKIKAMGQIENPAILAGTSQAYDAILKSNQMIAQMNAEAAKAGDKGAAEMTADNTNAIAEESKRQTQLLREVRDNLVNKLQEVGF